VSDVSTQQRAQPASCIQHPITIESDIGTAVRFHARVVALRLRNLRDFICSEPLAPWVERANRVESGAKAAEIIGSPTYSTFHNIRP
jgi:hypothetical protein